MARVTTFDSANLSAGSLSGGGLIFTSTALGYAVSSLTITGLAYGEVTITTLTGSPSIGVVGSTWSGNGSGQVGSNATGVGYLNSGGVWYNNVQIGTLATYTTGDRIGWAVDPLLKLVWFRKNNGLWNNSAGADPASGTGGLSFAAPASGATLGVCYIVVTASASGTVWTAKFSAPFTDTAPVGFSSMDVQQITRSWAQDAVGGDPVVALSTTAIARCAQLPTGDKAAQGFSPAGSITRVSGTIMESGITTGGKRVDVYDRATGELLGTAFSASDGTWSVPCLGRPSVRVVADDPTTYNSLVYDNVVPV